MITFSKAAPARALTFTNVIMARLYVLRSGLTFIASSYLNVVFSSVLSAFHQTFGEYILEGQSIWNSFKDFIFWPSDQSYKIFFAEFISKKIISMNLFHI